MDNYLMIERLKNAGISFEEGLSNAELALAERVLGIRFPAEIRAFLACGLPVGGGFYNWRDLSATNIQRFREFSLSIEDAFLFDIANDFDGLRAMFGDRFSEVTNQETFTEAVFNYLHQSTKLIPFYAHRCFFDGMDHMPIVSFWQPTDTIFYGENFEDYLETEFLGKQRCIKHPHDKMKDTGIWYYIIE